MSANTKIEWADHTFNPWIGCTEVSRAATGGGGCDGCYAKVSTPARVLRSNGIETWGQGAQRVRTQTWGDPVKWNKWHEAFYAQHGRRQRVFCASLADVFDNEVPPEWRADLFKLIRSTPNLDWLLLTKRIGNAQRMIEQALISLGDPATDVMGSWPWENVWIGATVVNQAEADRDIPKLLRVPAAKRFLSCEPLLGPLQLTRLTALDYVESPEGAEVYPLRGIYAVPDCDWPGPKLDWVIVGGESGPGARPMHPDWARSLRDQCQASGVPFFFKQWGEWAEVEGDYQLAPDDAEAEGYNPKTDCVITPDGRVFSNPADLPDDVLGRWMERIGKKAAGRLLDGRTWDGVPG